MDRLLAPDVWGSVGTAMEIVLDSALRGTVLLALAGLASVALRRRSAALRHLCWTAALGGMLILPLLGLGLPAWRVQILPPVPEARPASDLPQGRAERGASWSAAALLPRGEAAGTGSAPPTELPAGDGAASPLVWPAAGEAPAPRSHARLLAALWLGGAALVLAQLLAVLLHVQVLGRRANVLGGPNWSTLLRRLCQQLGLRREVRLLQARDWSVPMTWGSLRPVVLLPAGAEQWSVQRRRLVLLHELGHIRRLDCLTQMLAQLACAVYWFHPLVWIAARQLRSERERACDDLVLGSGDRPSEYAGMLLDIARSTCSSGCTSAATVAMARPSQLEGRLLAILDPAVSRRPVQPAAVGLVGALALSVLVPLAMLRPVAEAAELERDAAAAALVRDASEVAVLTLDGDEVPGGEAPDEQDFDVDVDVDVEDLEVDVDVEALDGIFAAQADEAPAGTGGTSAKQLTAGAVTGSRPPSVEQLIELRRHGVGPQLIQGLRQLGLELSLDEVLQLARSGVDADSIRKLREAGYTDLSVEHLAALGRHGVDAEYVRALAEAGYRNLRTDELIQLARHGVCARYVGELAEAGYRDLTVEQIALLARHGVRAQYVRELAEAGYRDLKVEQIASLARHGVDTEFVRKMRELGYADLTVEQLVELSRHGVDAQYVEEMLRQQDEHR